MKRSVFWDITPCSSLKGNRRFGRTCRLYLWGRKIKTLLAAVFILISCLVCSSTLKMEMTYYSETSVDLQQIIRRYMLEDRRFHKRHCKNLISFNWMKFLRCRTTEREENEAFTKQGISVCQRQCFRNAGMKFRQHKRE
jgi:hypothetical protein